jgi:hypothetical protein
MRREFLDQVLFCARDLERKLADFQTYYNAARSHASLEGHTPLFVAGELNRTGFVGGLIPREDQAHGPTKQVLPRTT